MSLVISKSHSSLDAQLLFSNSIRTTFLISSHGTSTVLKIGLDHMIETSILLLSSIRLPSVIMDYITRVENWGGHALAFTVLKIELDQKIDTSVLVPSSIKAAQCYYGFYNFCNITSCHRIEQERILFMKMAVG